VGTITVAGEGRITARPDLAITTLGVDVHATSLSEAMAEAAGTMERVWQALRGGGFKTQTCAQSDIQSRSSAHTTEDRTTLRLSGL